MLYKEKYIVDMVNIILIIQKLKHLLYMEIYTKMSEVIYIYIYIYIYWSYIYFTTFKQIKLCVYKLKQFKI